jgi:hypothetical protein
VLAGFFSILQVLGDMLAMTTTRPTWNDNREWNALLSYLPAGFRELAWEH